MYRHTKRCTSPDTGRQLGSQSITGGGGDTWKKTVRCRERGRG